MKVNSIGIVMAIGIALTASGCCWHCTSKCSKPCDEKTPAKCCNAQHGIGVNANVGGASAGAGVGSGGAHIEAKTGR
jgi:hypothetical protein